MSNSIIKSLKVLLVEDEKSLAKLLKEAIGDSFKEFSIAYNGIDGLDKFRKIRPDIVITDITMPNMSGLDLAAAIKSEDKTVPVIILSAYSDKKKLLGAIDVGVVKYFIKPFDPEELLAYTIELAQKMKEDCKVKLMKPFEYDIKSKQLFKNGVLVHLTKRESDFIFHLINSQGNYLSNSEIKEYLWDDELVSDDRLRTFIKRIRQKSNKSLIINISAQGYRLVTED